MELGALEDHHEKESNPSHNMDRHLSPTRPKESVRPRTMKDYALPTIGTQPSAILLDQASRNYELKSFHFNMLPSYYGRQDEDALQFMKDYCFMLEIFPLAQLTEDQLRMRCFPFCLKEKAKQWLMTLPSGTLTTWDKVCERFFTRFYPAEKARQIRIRIAEFSEEDGEPFHEAWERYKSLLGQCPDHMYTEEYKVLTFYDGLSSFTQTIVDNACGGAMRESTAREVLQVYEMLSQNSEQWNSSDRRVSRNEGISYKELTLQVANLTKQVQSFITNLGKQAGAKQVWGGEDYGIVVDQDREEEAQVINPYHQWSNNNISSSHSQPRKQPWEEVIESIAQATNAFQHTTQGQLQSNEQRMLSLEESIERLATQLGQLAENSQKQDKSIQMEQAKALTVLWNDESKPQEALKPVNSSKSSDDCMDELLKFFEELKEDEKEVKENNDLITLSVDLVMKVDMLEKERDSTLKIAHKLSKLVEEKKEEFAQKTRNMQMEVEKRDKALEAMKDELIEKDNALKVAQVMKCNYIVEIDEAEQTIKALKKEGDKQESTKKPRTSHPKGSHKKAEAKEKESKEMIEKQNELVKRSLDTAMEDAAGSETGSPSLDTERSQGVEDVGHEHETEIQELQIEDRVSRLEKILAELKSSKIWS